MNTIQARLAQHGVAFSGQIVSAAQRHGLDPQLLAAVAAQETGGPGSNAGANIVGDGGHGHGLFQIDDRWHRFATTPAAMDPANNADYAAGMISGLIKRYGSLSNPTAPAVHKALSAYNAGSPDATGTITQWGDGQRLGYADSVMRHYALLGPGAPAQAASSASPPGGVDSQSLIAEIFGEIEQINQMQSLAQTSPLLPQGPAAQIQPRSFAQPAAQRTSWAGLIDSGDDSN